MWDVILSILSIIGVTFLVLLALALLLLLLVLFYPITYRIKGRNTAEERWLLIKANWLSGLIQIRYSYPESGTVVVKVFGKKVFDSGMSNDNKKDENKAGSSTAQNKTKSEVPKKEAKTPKEDSKIITEASDKQTVLKEEGEENEEASSFSGKISKLKNTIQKAYDKINHIYKNISYYMELLQDKETQELWKHVKMRLGKVMKIIRPRHIKADVIFGTGSPDTTGYLFGVYGMFSPFLGPKVHVTPDFTQAILQGEADISGHITVYVLTLNALKLFFDKRLHVFMKKMKMNTKSHNN